MLIEYDLRLSDGRSWQFQIDLERPPDGIPDGVTPEPWTELRFQRCANCLLDPATFRYCPPAVDLQEIARAFRGIISYDELTVRVHTPQRDYAKRCSAQEALNALFGLVMATSGCPRLAPLRGLAHYHLPFASYEETLFRSVSAYLLKQYLIHRRGGQADWDLVGLRAFYEELLTLDTDFTNRIRAASTRDANINAINSLLSISFLAALSVDSALEELAPLFAPEAAKR